MKCLRQTMMTAGVPVLACALMLLAAGSVMAVELPAQADRIWAEPGDAIGLTPFWTASLDVMDLRGDAAKAAEDWQRVDKYRFDGIFGWHRVYEKDAWLTVRGAGDNDDRPGGGGMIGLWGGSPGKSRVSLSYRSYDHYYDTTSEVAAPAFVLPPAPLALDTAPVMNWNRGELAASRHYWEGFDLSCGAKVTRRHGDKGSLLHGGDYSFPPAVKNFGTSSREVWIGGDYAKGRVATDWKVTYRKSDGERYLNSPRYHDYRDDQTSWSGTLGAAVDVSPRLRLVGHAVGSYLESNPLETTGSVARQVTSDAVSGVGQLGALWSLAKATRLNVSATVRNQNVDGQVGPDDDVYRATDRDRTSQDYLAALTNTGLKHTRLRFTYRYRTTDLDETVAQNGLPESGLEGDNQTTDQQKTIQEAGFRGTTRLSRHASLRAKAGWYHEKVDQHDTWDTADNESWLYWMGDRKRDKVSGQASLHTRPARGVNLDVGYQVISQTFEREDIAGVKSTWDANRGFAQATWATSDRLTLLGSFSVGEEKYELTDVVEADVVDPASTPDPGPWNYDATTTRYSPAVVVDLGRGWSCEGHYEAVRNTDSVKNDLDRWYARASWRFDKNLSLTASYKRDEFEEKRWDNYILDLYTLSLGGVF